MLVWGGRRIGEAIGRLHQDEGRARDQAMVLQEPILFQIRRGLGLPSTRASIPPSWYRLYQS